MNSFRVLCFLKALAFLSCHLLDEGKKKKKVKKNTLGSGQECYEGGGV